MSSTDYPRRYAADSDYDDWGFSDWDDGGTAERASAPDADGYISAWRSSPAGAGARPSELSGTARRRNRARSVSAGVQRRRRFVALGLLGTLALAAVVVIWFLGSLFQPFTGSGSGRVSVDIPAESTSAVGNLLARKGVIASGFFFKLRAELSGDHLRAGNFTLAHGMSYSAALKVLTSSPGAAAGTSITVAPNESRWQLSKRLANQGVKGNYLAETQRSSLLSPKAYGAPAGTTSLEGFLYPDTYSLKPPASAKTLIASQLAEFKAKFKTVDMSWAHAHHLSDYEVLKVASLLAAEADRPADLPKVAGVIYNRLHVGMTLGLDTTTAYATHDYSGNLSASELKINSPYNTRLHKGLPPTPINSPDLRAIQAAAHPVPTKDVYFIVKVCGNGALAFTNNYQQFQGWSAAYKKAVAARGVQGAAYCKSSG
ncbi:MAG: endolytic transglycosylase MltG [Solirubrobacterales bacterium]|nr:endolytic transglycosylase MltG [Solirubrobacterales bacterium]